MFEAMNGSASNLSLVERTVILPLHGIHYSITHKVVERMDFRKHYQEVRWHPKVLIGEQILPLRFVG
jgi:hypothetical protein